MRVRIAYNLNKCKLGKPAKPGETCITVRTKQPAGWRNRAESPFVAAIAVRNVDFRVSQSGIDRIRAKQSREVIAMVEGEPCDIPSSVDGWERFGFNPFLDRGFCVKGEDGSRREIASCEAVYLDGRAAYVFNPVFK